MRKITKKVLSTVLVLSLLAGFGAISSFAAEDGMDNYETRAFLEGLKNENFGNNIVNPNFGISDALREFVVGKTPDWWRNFSGFGDAKWRLIGDILYLVETKNDETCEVQAMCPSCFDESGRPISKSGEPIKIINMPDDVDGLPVESFNYFGGSLQELFPDLEYIILSKNIKRVVDSVGLYYVSKPYKIYVPLGADCKYVSMNNREECYNIEGLVELEESNHIYFVVQIEEVEGKDGVAAGLLSNFSCTIM